jgi:autotransporter passenger strand-loop-strand repeat protein
VISAGGQEIIYAGTAIGSKILGGGKQMVEQPGTASAVTISNGGLQVDSATTIGTVISSGGVETVYGLASGGTVSSGGFEILFAGTASGTTVKSGGHLVLLPGATVSGITGSVTSTGVLTYVPGSGYALYPTSAAGVNITGYGSDEYVLSGGTASGGRLQAVTQTIYSGGTAISQSLVSGSEQYLSGGNVSGEILSDSDQDLQGGVATGTILTDYASQDVTLGTASGTTVNSGTSLYFYGGTEANAVIAGGYVDIAPGTIMSGSVTFSGRGGVLELDSSTLPTNVISGFTAGDGIDLTAYSYNGTQSVSVASAGVVTISSGGASFSLNIAGATVGETDFYLSTGLYGYGLELLKSATSSGAVPRMRFLRPHQTISASGIFGGGTEAVVLHAETMVAAYAGPVTTAASLSLGVSQDLALKPAASALMATPHATHPF